MITRVEYQSADGTRGATVLWICARHWIVQRRPQEGQLTVVKRASLTSAQSTARAWVDGGRKRGSK